MNREPNDADIRDRFAALRREDEERVMPFRAPRPRAAPSRTPLRWVAAAALTTAAAATLWMVTRSGTTGDRIALDLGSTPWVAPTDFLLETPGIDLLRSVPTIGVAEIAPISRGLREEPTDTGQPGGRNPL